MSLSNRYGVIILAAGQGKRMKSSIPKVLHRIGGKPLIFHILDKILETSPDSPVALVVGHSSDMVERAVQSYPGASGLNLTFIHQADQRGTGHAAQCVMESEWGETMVRSKTALLLLPGDLPLIPPDLIRQMQQPLGRSEVLRLLTCNFSSPSGYGRVIRRGKRGDVLRIVEERDANQRERAISEVAASIYLFQSPFLRFALQRLSNKNALGEYYLTDLVSQAVRSKKKVDILLWENQDDLRGVNDSWELALAGKILNERCIKNWALKGVKFIDPWRTWVDVTVDLEEDVTVYQGATLFGDTRVARGAVIGPNVVLRDVEVGRESYVKTGTVAEESRISDHVSVGPYAHLRPGSIVGAKAKIGNFVELKKTVVGEDTSIAHLSYLGDAEVGRRVNIGCGFITCNFDGRVVEGRRKHRTVIEDDVFLGSDCQTIAPVRIGKGAYIASGSTITEDVEADALAIARSRQVTKAGYARKIRGPVSPDGSGGSGD